MAAGGGVRGGKEEEEAERGMGHGSSAMSSLCFLQ